MNSPQGNTRSQLPKIPGNGELGDQVLLPENRPWITLIGLGRRASLAGLHGQSPLLRLRNRRPIRRMEDLMILRRVVDALVTA